MHKKTNEEFRTQVYKLVGDDYTFLEPFELVRIKYTENINSI